MNPSEKSKVLVVEDEADVRELMLLHLTREGCDAQGVVNGEEALQLLRSRTYALLVVDWMLPGFSGIELCKQMAGRLPILMVTARAETTDIVRGLEAGADDYITKPFDIPVFLARVRALLRRERAIAAQKTVSQAQDLPGVKIKGLRVDADSHRVFCNETEVTLTPSEFKLLHALILNQGKVLSRERLIELVQGQGVAVVDRAIDTHVFGLRKKLGDCAEVIETVRGVGYRIDPI